jgi:hypothetical protein
LPDSDAVPSKPEDTQIVTEFVVPGIGASCSIYSLGIIAAQEGSAPLIQDKVLGQSWMPIAAIILTVDIFFILWLDDGKIAAQ